MPMTVSCFKDACIISCRMVEPPASTSFPITYSNKSSPRSPKRVSFNTTQWETSASKVKAVARIMSGSVSHMHAFFLSGFDKFDLAV